MLDCWINYITWNSYKLSDCSLLIFSLSRAIVCSFNRWCLSTSPPRFDTFLYLFIFILFISAHSLGFIFIYLFCSNELLCFQVSQKSLTRQQNSSFGSRDSISYILLDATVNILKFPIGKSGFKSVDELFVAYKPWKRKFASFGSNALGDKWEKKKGLFMVVRLNFINHLVGFIPSQICLYFSN